MVLGVDGCWSEEGEEGRQSHQGVEELLLIRYFYCQTTVVQDNCYRRLLACVKSGWLRFQ